MSNASSKNGVINQVKYRKWASKNILSCAGGWWYEAQKYNNVLWYKPVYFIDILWYSLKTTWSAGVEQAVHGKRAILKIPCVYYVFKYMLDKLWATRVSPSHKSCYQPVQDFTYWPVLGSFNNWNIIKF